MAPCNTHYTTLTMTGDGDKWDDNNYDNASAAHPSLHAPVGPEMPVPLCYMPQLRPCMPYP
jgi:hypothetical protein